MADMQIPLLLGAIAVAMLLFSVEKIKAELTALSLLMFLVLTGLLSTQQAFASFGSDVVIMMLGLLILMAALERTGVTDFAGRLILGQADSSPLRLLVVVMVAAVALGGFVSNTAATAFFLPIVVGLARQRALSPARFLMPLAFASILASSITLIGTSTNIAVSGMITNYDLNPIDMFELTPVGIPIALVGLAYMLLVGRHLVPDRTPADQLQTISERLYLSEFLIPEGSSLVGKTLHQAELGQKLDLKVVRILRGSTRYVLPRASTRLEGGDVLLVEGRRADILRAEDWADVEIRPDVKFSLPDLESGDLALMEVILLPGSPLIGRTLEGLNFREQFGLQVLAINRNRATLVRKMSGIRLRQADVLVVQGEREHIRLLEQQDLFRILGSTMQQRPRKKRAPLAGAIFAGTLAAASFDLLSLPVAMLLGALLVMLTRCITPEEAYSHVDWSVLILIASMLAMGVAMEATGAAHFLAERIVALVGSSRPAVLLSAFFLLTVMLTQPMSNQAAAAVVLPVALDTAIQLDLNPRSFGIMIAVAASCSFLTPLEPACMLVYGPGRYRFFDFPRVGLLLSLLVYAIAILMVPWLWPV